MSKLFLVCVASGRGPSLLVRSNDKCLMREIRDSLWGAYPHSIETYAGNAYDAYFGATREVLEIPREVEVEYAEIDLAEFLAGGNGKEGSVQ